MNSASERFSTAKESRDCFARSLGSSGPSANTEQGARNAQLSRRYLGEVYNNGRVWQAFLFLAE
jgi:hypothetical protein